MEKSIWLLSVMTLLIGSSWPKNFAAIFSVITTEFLFFNAVCGFPLTNGIVNMANISASVNPTVALNLFSPNNTNIFSSESNLVVWMISAKSFFIAFANAGGVTE